MKLGDVMMSLFAVGVLYVARRSSQPVATTNTVRVKCWLCRKGKHGSKQYDERNETEFVVPNPGRYTGVCKCCGLYCDFDYDGSDGPVQSEPGTIDLAGIDVR